MDEWHRGIRPCGADELPSILAVINAGAIAYRGVIPPDRWHEPYMTNDALRRDVAHGVAFLGMKVDGALVGVMGVQQVRDVDLIRHAYVLPGFQRRGVGQSLMNRLLATSARPQLVGTWAAAHWAIAFYERNGFTLVDRERKDSLLAMYWDVPARQREVSVVLERGTQ